MARYAAPVVRPSPRVFDALGTLIRLGLAAVWLGAGIPKVLNLDQNYVAVRAYKLLPDGVAGVVASGQPFFEVVLGLLLLLGIGIRLVAIVSALLMLIYIAGIVSVWARGLSIDCGCFSTGGAVASGQTHYLTDILRDSGFVLLSTWLIVRPRTLVSLDGLFRGGSPAVDIGGMAPNSADGEG